MAFQNPVQNITVPNGAGSGQARIVIGTDIPEPLKSYKWANNFLPTAAIIYYKSNGDYTFEALFDYPDHLLVLKGVVVAGAVLEVGIGSPQGFGLDTNNSSDKTTFDISVNTIDPGNSACRPLYGCDPTDQTFIDVWNPNIQFRPAAGWSGGMKTRQVASPAYTHQVYGGLVMGGTKANGTVIGDLNTTQRRPAQAADIPCTCNNVVGGGESPHLNIQPDGRVLCYGFTAATVGFANGFYSTDF